MLKKYWPVILLGVGLLVVIIAFFVMRGNKNDEIPVEEEEVVAEIPFEQRPFVSLTPTSDGHYLNFKIVNIGIEAETLDYELLYKTQNDITQGVPGTFRLSGKDELTADLLLGSESSGKFRYDEGVEEGTLSLKFRNEKGKLVGKLLTEFRLFTDTDELSSADGALKFSLSDYDETGFFVVMDSFGLPGSIEGNVVSGPVGVFASDEAYGDVEFGSGKVMNFVDGDWEEVDGETSVGVFVEVE